MDFNGIGAGVARYRAGAAMDQERQAYERIRSITKTDRSSTTAKISAASTGTLY